MIDMLEKTHPFEKLNVLKREDFYYTDFEVLLKNIKKNKKNS